MTNHSPRSRAARRRGLAIAGAVALVLVVVARAAAHDTWLIAASNLGRVGTPFRLALSSGEKFAVDDFAIEPARVTRALVREGAVVRHLPQPTTGALALQYAWSPRAPGVATVGIELRPTTLTLEPKLIDEYLGEIDADSATRARWSAFDGKKQWTESYTKHALTFVRVVPAKPDANWIAERNWKRPLGLALELVPESDPTALHAGDTLTVRVLRRGTPLRNFAVGAILEGRTKAIFFRTDTNGRAGIIVDKAGRWLLNGTDLRPATTGATVWESDFVTATLHVAPRR